MCAEQLKAISRYFGAMAKRKRFTRKQRTQWVRCNFAVSLGTLGVATHVVGAVGVGVGQEFWAIAAKITWSLEDLTTGQGPIAVGLGHSDYSATEVKEWFEATGILTGDEIALEQMKRKCRDVGTFAPGAASDAPQGLNGGKPVFTKLGFRCADSQQVNMWARNTSTAALATTTPFVRGHGWILLRPL